MRKDTIKELAEAAKVIAEGNFGKELKPDFDGALAELAAYIEKIRRNMLVIDPNIRESSVRMPEASNHLMDINKTLLDAAERLMSITEKVMENHEKTSNSLDGLVRWIEKLPQNGEGMANVEDLLAINKETRSYLTEILTNLSFQDLAGQKIKKMNKIIEEVEAKILEMLIVFGRKEKIDGVKRDQMLKGLKDGDGALRQNVVDDILKGFNL